MVIYWVLYCLWLLVLLQTDGLQAMQSKRAEMKSGGALWCLPIDQLYNPPVVQMVQPQAIHLEKSHYSFKMLSNHDCSSAGNSFVCSIWRIYKLLVIMS